MRLKYLFLRTDRYVPSPGGSVPDDLGVASFISGVPMTFHVVRCLCLQGFGQHASSPFTGEVIQMISSPVERGLVWPGFPKMQNDRLVGCAFGLVFWGSRRISDRGLFELES